MNKKPYIQAILLLLTLILMLTLPAYALTETSELDQQVKELTAALEAKRKEHHIPGMAIAVVKDNQVILSHGFGLMDLEKNTPVEPDTLFAIGSSSKAFTATLIAMMVDQKKMAWDDPVSQYLPDYQFKVDGKVLPITLRDMLSHRTGYTRNDLLWANGKANRSTILKTAVKGEPVDEFRKNFYYNNVMFLAAGEAMSKVTGNSWDDSLQELILKPLGMNQSTSIHEQAILRDNISLGYQWNEVTEEHDLLPRRNLNNIAPAGGIYSNVNDMAQWLRLLLNKGQIKQGQEDETIISEQQLLETHQAHIDIAYGVDYGLGWMLRKWQNQTVIEHGGNIDGYGAQVAFMPESNLGFVLLTNVTASPLQQTSMNIVWEHLAANKSDEESASQQIDYHQYTGEYNANFGPFKEAIFTFLVKEDGTPAVDVPGQMIYDLNDPDETGKWYFKMTDTISISFERDEKGAVEAMRMQQNGFNFELPKKGMVIQPEVELSSFDEFLGQYNSKKLNGTITAMIQNNRLTMDVPNQMAFELHLPDDEGFRQFRIKADTAVKFIKNESGQVTGVELYKNKSELVETATKTEQAATEVLPTVKDIMKLRKSKKRLKALKKNDGFMLTGNMNIKSSGIIGQVTTQFDHDKKFRQKIDFGVFGEINTVVNNKQGSSYGITPYTALKGKYLKQAQRESPAANYDWHAYYDQIEVINSTDINGVKAYKVVLKEDELPAITVFIDSDSGDILKSSTQVLVPSIGSIRLKVNYSDYREQHGLRMPFKVTINHPMMGDMVIQYNEFKAKQTFDDDLFNTEQPAN